MDIVIVDQGLASMYRFIKPRTIQPFGNTLDHKQTYLQT